MRKIKIGAHTEYHEPIKHSCGHIIEAVTLNYKITKTEKSILQAKECPGCRLKRILEN